MRKPRAVKQPPLDPALAYNGSTQLPNTKEELFCQLYTSNTTPRFFGHGQNSYTFAYGYQEELDKIIVGLETASTNSGRGKKKVVSAWTKLHTRKLQIEGTCRTCGARLLTKAHIIARCNFLMDQLIEDKIVDRELAFVIQQRHDLSSKTQAITHYDKKRGRLIEKREDLIKFEPITSITFVTPEKPV